MDLNDYHFLKLPTEILLLIAYACSQQQDLAAWARTCQRFHSIVNPLLYENEISRKDWRTAFWAAERGIVGTLKHWCSIRDPDGHIRGTLDVYTTRKDSVQYWELGSPEATSPSALWSTRYVLGPLAPTAWGRYPYCCAPLHVAAKAGHKDVVDFMLDHGADINAPSMGLLSRGISIFYDARDRSNAVADNRIVLNALHIAIISSREQSGHAEVAETLVQRGIDLALRPVHAGRDNNITALHLAAAYSHLPGNLAVLQMIGKLPQVDVNAPDIDGQTPLMYAAESNKRNPSISVFAILKEIGADINGPIKTVDGIKAPLLVALIQRNRWRAAARLIDVGASLEVEEGHRSLLEECKRARMSIIHPETVDQEAYTDLVTRLERRSSTPLQPDAEERGKAQRLLKRVVNIVRR